MTRLFGWIGLLAVLFYAVWPGYSAYRLKTALDAGDGPGLERGIDFPSVRASLKPAVQAKVEKSLEAALKPAGSTGGVVLGQLGKDMVPKLVDTTLDTLVTPAMLIKLHQEGRTLKDGLDGLVKEQPNLAGKVGDLLGGLLGKVGGKAGTTGPGTEGGAATGATGAGATTPARKPLGLANVKSVSFDGPLALKIGLARDGTQREPDVTAKLAFTGTGWMVTELVPRL